VAEHIEASKPAPRQTLTFNVPKERRQRLIDLVRNAGAEEQPAKEHEAWRMKLTHGLSQATIILYNSGSCVLPSGTAPAFDELAGQVRAALEGLGGEPRTPNSEGSARTSHALPADYDPEKPHIGTDEAGKGDFFGPLVSAAVFVDSSLGSQLKRLGVRDSKTMSDRTARRLASEIRRLAGKRAAITLVAPKRYNELYSQMRSEGKNLNTLLAWGHARSIEDLLLNGLRPAFVVVDQFADTRYMQQKILADTRQSGLPIVQFPKAEADIAVAAASVLARDGFLEWLETSGRQLGRPLPKGASQAVIDAAREIVASHGPDILREYAKTSFKTMQAVLAP
jgi:ribonuclease HIII